MKKNTVFEDILSTLTRYFVILVAIVVVLICLSGVRIVKSGEVAVVLRFGKLVGNTYEEQVHEPGLFFAFPYIIDEVITVPVGSVKELTVTTHYTEGEMLNNDQRGYVITGDQNIAVISASVKYNITDAVSYALHVKDADRIINAAVSGAMVKSAAHRAVDGILTSEKEAYATEVRAMAQQTLDEIGTGITLSNLELTKVSMPEEVRETYENVNAATVQAATLAEKAQQYRDSLMPYAESMRTSLISNAYSKQSTAIAEAEQYLAEFRGVLEEYEANPDSLEAIKTRIYTQKMMEMLARIKKVYLVPDDESHIIIK